MQNDFSKRLDSADGISTRLSVGDRSWLSQGDPASCVIDGGKGLRTALGAVFGDAAVIQRCQLHKARNLDAVVPQARQSYVRAALRRAYRAASAAAVRRQLRALAAWLERNGHAGPVRRPGPTDSGCDAR
jgi:hypothetical protein